MEETIGKTWQSIGKTTEKTWKDNYRNNMGKGWEKHGKMWTSWTSCESPWEKDGKSVGTWDKHGQGGKIIGAILSNLSNFMGIYKAKHFTGILLQDVLEFITNNMICSKSNGKVHGQIQLHSIVESIYPLFLAFDSANFIGFRFRYDIAHSLKFVYLKKAPQKFMALSHRVRNCLISMVHPTRLTLW